MTTTPNGCTYSAEPQIAYLEKCRDWLIEESKKSTNAGRVGELRVHIQDLDKRIAEARAAYQKIQPIIQATPPSAPRLWAPGSSTGNTQGLGPAPTATKRGQTAHEQTGDPP